MTIEYVAAPADVTALYTYCGKHCAYFRRRMIFNSVLLGFSVLLVSFIFDGTIRIGDVIFVLILVSVFPFAICYIARLRTKKDKRTLTVDSTGFHTRIGARSGNVPWSRIADVFVTEDHIFILGRNLNGFCVPRNAFATPSEREQFILLCRDHPFTDDALPKPATSIERKFNLFAGRNRIYSCLIIGLCVAYGIAATMLPYTRGYAGREIVILAYAASKASIFPLLYFWLICDSDKSLPWRNHPIIRYGTAATILMLVYFYMHSVHSTDMPWGKLALSGALFSVVLAFVEMIQRRT